MCVSGTTQTGQDHGTGPRPGPGSDQFWPGSFKSYTNDHRELVSFASYTQLSFSQVYKYNIITVTCLSSLYKYVLSLDSRE